MSLFPSTTLYPREDLYPETYAENPIIREWTDATRLSALLEGRRGPREWAYELWRSNLAGELLESGPFRRVEPLRTVATGSVNLSNFRDHTWELGVNMRADETLDLFADYVKLYVTLRDGEEWLRFPMGLYRFDFPRGTDTPMSTTWDLVGRSPEVEILDDMADKGYKVNAGTGVLAAVRTILLNRGVPASRINLPTSDKTLARAMFFDPLQDVASCYYLRICNALLSAGGFYALWCDAEGKFTTREIEDATKTSVDVTYGTTESSERLLQGEISWEYGDERFANRVVVWAGGAQGTIPVSGVAENRDPDSRLSIENYGRVVQGEPVVLENLVSQTEANKIAKAHLRIASGTDLKLTFSTFCDPRREPRDRYALDVLDDDGVRLWGGRWRVQGWQMPLDFSGMQHEVYREIRL